jgi:hypothetical protein
MTTDERIITFVRTEGCSYIDGSKAKEMLVETKESGLTVEEVYGDKSYFRKTIRCNWGI